MVTRLLEKGGFVMCNRTVVKVLGYKCGVLLGELCYEHDYWKSRRRLKDGGWFFSTVDNIRSATSMNRSVQDSCIEILKESGIIDCDSLGFPKTRHFRIDEDALARFIREHSEDGAEYGECDQFVENLRTVRRKPADCASETGELNADFRRTVRRKSTINKKLRIKTKNKNNIPEKFAPTLDDIKYVCEQDGFVGASGDTNQFAEWFYEASKTEDGTLMYKGSVIKNYASLVSLLRAVNASGRQVARERSSSIGRRWKRREPMDDGSFL